MRRDELCKCLDGGSGARRRRNKLHPRQRPCVVIPVGSAIVRRKSPERGRHPLLCTFLRQSTEVDPRQPDVVSVMKMFVGQLAPLERSGKFPVRQISPIHLTLHHYSFVICNKEKAVPETGGLPSKCKDGRATSLEVVFSNIH